MPQNHSFDFTSSSSNIGAVRFECEGPIPSEGQESENVGQLFVTFRKGGAVYRYDNVPLSVYDAMIDAEQSDGSCGKFFISNVRSSFFFEKVED